MELSPEAESIAKKRYYKDGEDWEKLCHRVATFLAGDNKANYLMYFGEMVHRRFLPNTPCLINAGTDKPQMSACFLVPVEDSIESIFDAIKNTAKIHQYGGGTGFNFSYLRPEGSPVGKAKGVSSGPVSFMQVFDAATQQMKQGGVRRGANMGLMMIDHPDIVKFIKCKRIDGKINNFNISIGITDTFMQTLEEAPNHKWVCKFGDKKYIIEKNNIEPEKDGMWWAETQVGTSQDNDVSFYSVQDIWNLICKQAWHNGEPGIIFMDTIWKKNGFEIQGVNPCGEQILEPYEACVLGSIDVSKFIRKDTKVSPFNWFELEQTIKTAVNMLNAVVDKGEFPIKEITNKVKANRKIGLGVMGWADALLLLKIKYGSDESLMLAEELMQFINTTAHKYSAQMNYGNKTCTTIAPTGTISILANCSSGIEPNFAWLETHKRMDGEIQVKHRFVNNIANLPDYYVTAQEITPEAHVRMQAAFQKYTDNAVSKTINLSETASKEDVEQAFLLAYELGCKGITVYRDGSRVNQVISNISDNKDKTKIEESKTFLEVERPYTVPGKTYKLKIDLGDRVENVYLTVNCLEPGIPYELFLAGNIREVDRIVGEFIDTTTRLVSLAMRAGTPLSKLIEQLEKVPGTALYSLPIKIANALREYLNASEQPLCPDCGNIVHFQEGCMKCSCGWSKCS